MSYLAATVLAVALITAESEGEKAFTSWANLAVGGVWSGTVDGVQFEDTYQWVLNKRFLRFASKSKEASEIHATSLIGIDPKTGKATWWLFDEEGAVGQGTMTWVTDGVWSFTNHSDGPRGKQTWTAVVTKLGENQVRVESEMVTNGKSEGKQVVLWTRSSK